MRHQCLFSPKRVFQRKVSLHSMLSFCINHFYDKTSFVSLHIAIWITICLKYPFETNDFHTLWQWDNILNAVVLYGFNLVLYGFNLVIHGINPLWEEFELSVAWQKLIESSSIIPMSTSCSWINTIDSYCILLYFSLVDLLNGVCFWDVRVCYFGTISCMGIQTLSWFIVPWTKSRKKILSNVNDTCGNIRIFLFNSKVLNHISPCKLDILKKSGIS